ncbi:MAG: hypothetical protein H7A24_16045 [Leptospiraceae bacterium]|nr:hypothetical protein [Leptospiraceae bacterium]MCP5513399.1 hypothetical protein [Leptospiraceae bacterium]
MFNLQYLVIFLWILSFSSLSAQKIGDPSLGSISVQHLKVSYPIETSVYRPRVLNLEGSIHFFWGEGTSGEVGIFRSRLNQKYQIKKKPDVLIPFTGKLNSSADSLSTTMSYDSSTGNFLAVYMSADRTERMKNVFSMRAVLGNPLDKQGKDILIEGEFFHSLDLPGSPSVSGDGNGNFLLVYHSNGADLNQSYIKWKKIDAETGRVTPGPIANKQTGSQISTPGARNPSVVWNPETGTYGIVFVSGKGNASILKFLSIDKNGVPVSEEKTILSNPKIMVARPVIAPDGDGFALIWQDFRQVKVPSSPPMSGIPAVRFTRIDSAGKLRPMKGEEFLFDTKDSSLLLSNPYNDASYLYQELKTIEPGKRYAAVWATGQVPHKIQMTEIHLKHSEIRSMPPVTVSEKGKISGEPDFVFDGKRYIIVYNQHEKNKYKLKVSLGIPIR